MSEPRTSREALIADRKPCRWCSGTGLEPPPAKICECPAFANAKGPYPSGICPDCDRWYPGMTREEARKRGHVQ